MRIVVSGTHASGKSTLIADFVARHPSFTVLPDPFELLDESWDQPTAGLFAAQLRLAADRLLSDEFDGDLIAERGPLDFLAYLHALHELGRAEHPDESVPRADEVAQRALSQVDLLVVLPLVDDDGIVVGDDEDLELRDAADRALLDLIDDPDLVGDDVRVAEITGDRAARLVTLEALVESARSVRR
ncbi:hypothetical protein GCM10022200_19830 [Microbacterium awajiense]|uniref:NadR/Ttd14 AAA domain-containing protein n=1 Tax=Microbacterium awajiense TaxID=415214 RepID=A0ABP7APC1_9MICO